MNFRKIKDRFKDNIELVASALAAAFFVAVVVPYLSNFGAGWSDSNEVWGQFGDYVGGSLNPIFGLLTLLVILFNTRIQRKELENNKAMMLAHSNMMNRQLELVEQKAIEEFTFQLLEEARTDESVQKARSNEWETLLGIYILYSNEKGEYDPSFDAYDERADLASEHFRSEVGIEFGAFSHIVYPKMLALIACTNKLPEQNRIFLANLIKTRFGMGVLSALVQFSLTAERAQDYNELKKLTVLLQGVGEHLIFSQKVCRDFCSWLKPEEIQSNVMKSRDVMTAELARRRKSSGSG